jgi:hypothetical protein
LKSLRIPVAWSLLYPAGMSRFEDRTTNWFTEGESVENLMATDVLEPGPKKPLWPMILTGVAGATALAACAFVLVGRKPAQPVVAPQVAVAAAPCSTPKRAEPAPPVAAPEPVATPEPVDAPEPVASTTPAPAPEPVAEEPTHDRLAKVIKQRARVAPKPTRAPMAQQDAGEKLLAKGQNAAALAEFQREIKANHKDIRALRGACTALGRQGRVNDAARVCRRALSLQPNDVETRAQLASLYYHGGAYKWSANEWKRVLALRPTDANAKRGLKLAQARL